MIRSTLSAAAAALMFVTLPVAAQTAPAAPQSASGPGTEAWLRLRGETYSAAPDSEQDPAEVSTTARLNAEVAARNVAADAQDAENAATYEAEMARSSAEAAAFETRRAQYEAELAVAAAARAAYDRARAAWESRMAACERARRVCVSTPPKG